MGRVDRWGLAIFAACVVFPFLGSFGLLEPDEGRFAQIGREMAANGNYLVPHLNGIEQFYKPPLVYWVNAIGYKIFGVSGWRRWPGPGRPEKRGSDWGCRGVREFC